MSNTENHSTIISYRSPADQYSTFLKVEDLLQSNDSEKIKEVYRNILCSVTAYEPERMQSLVRVEETIYNHIVSLDTKRKKIIQAINSGWSLITLLVLTIGIAPLILLIKGSCIEFELNQIAENRNTFSHALDQIKIRGNKKEFHPKPKAIKELEEAYLSDVEQELVRLKSIPRIAASLAKTNKNLSERHQVAFGRSLELREKLKETHYVINHGQNIELMILNTVARKLKQEFETNYFESFEPLRHDTMLRHIKEDVHTVTWYQNKIRQRGVTDHDFSAGLLSGDCVLESTSSCESALDFFSRATNVANKHDYLTCVILPKVINSYILEKSAASKLCKDLLNVMNGCPRGNELYAKFAPYAIDASGRPRGGNLYSICIPKEKFDESCYFSKPYGKPLENQQELKEKLDEMQSGEDPSGYPQIRVLTHKIRPENGYHVVVNSTLTNEQIEKIDHEVSLCIQAALTGYRIQKSPERIFL